MGKQLRFAFLACQSLRLFFASPDVLAWDKAYGLASQTLAEMTLSEKYELMKGVGWDNTFNLRKWWYVGNTPAIPRLNIPSLNMQDASSGFRTYWTEMVGTVTCWPSLLAIAATWDPDAVRLFAQALGEEFRAKGANAILGPSVEVHRVARNGRNFEYLSGEDPFLGARLTQAYVEGVQSKGLFAVVKHWVGNQQETNRGGIGSSAYSSNFDDKTAWELYFPPIEAAVNAGVSALMCSYNKVNGAQVCSNKKLFDDLRKKMGFQGFVQTDWWAAHGSASLGLDQEMPGSGDFSKWELVRESPKVIDQAAARILAVMHRHDLANATKCIPPNCMGLMRRNVTGHSHRALARTLAADSIVLLKNDRQLLPLSLERVQKIAVVGAAAAADPYDPNGKDQGGNAWNRGDYYSGGGSGHLLASHTVKPIDGIMRHAHAVGIQLISSTTNDIPAALAAASEADVVIVVGATTSGEGEDRENLNLDEGADLLIEKVSAVKPNRTVVLVQAPGSVLMPWRNHVSSILLMFLGGQETGSAWADVIFGDVAPNGRLPLMIPASEVDTIPPSRDMSIPYSEGLATSYRNPHFVAAFPFGHGLTYTTFRYTNLSVSLNGCTASASIICVSLSIANSGDIAGKTVAQLYLEFPPVAHQPSPILKGFKKTGMIMPGQLEHVSFALSRRDLSYYDAPQEIPSENPSTCCADCEGYEFCSPRSRNCYREKRKDYYTRCHCCELCANSGFCSPHSGNCYQEKFKHYYENCTTLATIPSVPAATGWKLAEGKFIAHIGESAVDIRLSLPFVAPHASDTQDATTSVTTTTTTFLV